MRHRCLLGLAWLALCTGAGAENTTKAGERERFRSLLDTARTQGLADHRDALARLADYPLAPYLVAADLTWRLNQQPDKTLDREIRDFVDAHPDLPPAWTLRRRWVESLAERQRWPLVLEYVRDGDATSLRCIAAQARIELDKANAAKTARDLWLTGHSQPEACDPVFAWLEETGRLKTALIKERARLAVLDREYGMTRYLRGKLPEAEAESVAGWRNLMRNPGDLHTAHSPDPDIAVAAFKRLALQNVDVAADLLPKAAERWSLSAPHRYEVARYIALLYAQDHREKALDWFRELDDARMDEFARAWRVRAALRQGAWDQALDWIASLPPAMASEERWRYWRARALEATGRQDEALELYGQLAKLRSYHGYLAADRLGREYALNRRTLERDETTRAHLLRRPGIQRARELLALDMRHAARREWHHTTQNLSKPQLQQAALLAHDWDWHARAIISLAQSDYWDDLEIRYPTPFAEPVRAHARRHELDPAYVLAIIRTESLFMPDAQSPAGALGLMQLMPATARDVAADEDLGRPDRDALTRPDTNIRLGTAYLRQMLDRFGESLPLATAAYNAGPHRIDRWLPASDLAADIWIETIPYTETRKYVQRAMAHMTVFQARLGHPIQPLQARMAQVSPQTDKGAS